MGFLGDFISGRPTEVTFPKSIVIGYVNQLFRRPDFPKEVFIVLADGVMNNKGDAVWANQDCEHPYDFVPLPRFDDLVLNLPTKEEFLKQFGAESFKDVTLEAEAEFWGQYQFKFAEEADGVKLIWE